MSQFNKAQLGMPKSGNRLTKWLGTTLLNATGWKVEGTLPDKPKMVIAVAPHTSNWDFFLGVAVLFHLGIKIRFLGKHTIFKPGLKQLLGLIGGMPVDRRSPHGIVKQVAVFFQQNEQFVLAIAPEGTRSPVFPWKSGFLAIAKQADVSVELIGFDFKYKKVLIGPSIVPTNDTESDLQRVYDFFKTVNAKYQNSVRYHA